jgi:hypothetical protein
MLKGIQAKRLVATPQEEMRLLQLIDDLSDRTRWCSYILAAHDTKLPERERRVYLGNLRLLMRDAYFGGRWPSPVPELPDKDTVEKPKPAAVAPVPIVQKSNHYPVQRFRIGLPDAQKGNAGKALTRPEEPRGHP